MQRVLRKDSMFVKAVMSLLSAAMLTCGTSCDKGRVAKQAEDGNPVRQTDAHGLGERASNREDDRSRAIPQRSQMAGVSNQARSLLAEIADPTIDPVGKWSGDESEVVISQRTKDADEWQFDLVFRRWVHFQQREVESRGARYESGVLTMDKSIGGWFARDRKSFQKLFAINVEGDDYLLPSSHVPTLKSKKQVKHMWSDGFAYLRNRELRATVEEQDVPGIYCVAFSPDSQRIVSGAQDGVLRIWNAATGDETLVIAGHMSRVLSVAWSADRKSVAATGMNATGFFEKAAVWNAETGHEFFKFGADATVIARNIAFGPNHIRMVTKGKDENLNVVAVETGRKIASLGGHGHGDRPWGLGVAWGSDGERMATSDYNSLNVKLWDLETEQLLFDLEGHGGMICSVAISSDGKRIATASLDRTVKIWSTESGRELMSYEGHYAIVFGVAFGPEGKLLASCSGDETVHVWNAETGQTVLMLEGDVNLVWSVAFSPDGERIATAGVKGAVKVWDAETGENLLTLPPNLIETDKTPAK